MTFTVTYDTNHSKSVLVRVAHQVFGETFQTSDSNFSVSFEHHRIKVVCADVMSEADQTLWLQYLERIFAGSDIQLDTTGDDRWLRELPSVNVTGYHHKEDGSQEVWHVLGVKKWSCVDIQSDSFQRDELVTFLQDIETKL